MRDAAHALEERRQPRRDPSERERVRGEAGAGQDVRAVARERAVGVHRERQLRLRRGRLGLRVLLPHSARCIWYGEGQERQQQTRHARHEERSAPAEMCVHSAAQHVPQRRTDRDRAVEDRHDAAARRGCEVVRQDGGRDRAVGGLADADRCPRDEQRGERSDEPADRRGQAPQGDAKRYQTHARHPIAERAEERRRQHVDDEKRRHQPAEPRVARMPHDRIFSEALEQRRHDVPVDVVEHVDQREHDERARAQLHEIPVCRRPCRHGHSLAVE